jgi:hypothetical protein
MSLRVLPLAAIGLFAAGLESTGCVLGCDAGASPGSTASALAAGQTAPARVAVGRTQVYWSSGDGSVERVPKAGGAVAVVAGPGGSINGLAADGDDVFWTTDDAVYVADASGAAPRRLVDGLAHAGAITLDANSLYWLERDSGSVVRLARMGGVPVTIARGEAVAGGLAVDGGVVYWSTGAAVRAAAPGSGAAVVAALGHTKPVDALVARGGNVAWIEATDDTHAQLQLVIRGGAPKAIASGALADALVAGSGGLVYVDSGVLRSISWDGGTTTALDEGDDDVASLGLGASTVYFTAPGSGRVMQVLERS